MERKTFQLEERQLRAVEKLKEDQGANNSEAIRVALNRGLRELGYLDGLPRLVNALRVATMLLLLQCGGAIVAYGVLNQPVLQNITMWFAGGAIVCYAGSKYAEVDAHRSRKKSGGEL